MRPKSSGFSLYMTDLGPINITKILMLPNVTTAQLVQAIDKNPKVQQDLCQCVGATDTAAAVARCLCADSSEWWERSVTDHGQDTNMTNDIYERLVARFCGPATSIEVPTVTTPRRCMELRTETEAIAHTGDEPEDCERCADNIVNLLVELRVGQSGHDLQYRDTVILCHGPRDNLPVVSRLRARGLPVQVVTSRDDEAAIRDVALAQNDTIMVTDSVTRYKVSCLSLPTSVNVWEQQIPLPLWPAVFVPTVPSGNLPENCERCADNIVNLLVELRVGQSGHDLQYRDTIILCRVPRDNLPVVRRLRARGLPVQVVTSDDDEAAIRDLAVTMNDTIMVTDSLTPLVTR
nr:hypothetical protein BaRGS_001829 [Batillaria attramentaria]